MHSVARLAVFTAPVASFRLQYEKSSSAALLRKNRVGFRMRHPTDGATAKLDPQENEHPNPFAVKDWYPLPENPNKKENEDPDSSETKATAEANAEAENEGDAFSMASYEAEAAKVAAEKDAFDEEKKKKAAELEAKAAEAKKAEESAKKKAEETKKAAMKALETNYKAKIKDLTDFKNKELKKCAVDLRKAQQQWWNDQSWFNGERSRASRDFRDRVNRAHWFVRWIVRAREFGNFLRRVRSLQRQMRGKRNAWSQAQRKYHKCKQQRHQFDWAIKQAHAKYNQARGAPEPVMLGCFIDKPRRAMRSVRGRHSIATCAKKCARKGFETMAIQYGHQCFCGRKTMHEKYGKVKDSDCSKPCDISPEEREDPKKKCGAAWRNSVYKLK